MNNYLCILLRARFTLWYRFGFITLGNNELIPFNGTIGKAEKEAIQLRFEQLPFEYDEEYLIFHLTNGQNSGNETIFSVHDIATIYPLSAYAKQSIMQKSDQRIHFADPFFTPSELENLTRILDFNERMAGVHALWQSVFGAEADIEPYLEKLDITHLQKAVANRAAGLKCAQIEDGHYLEYLFAYDRTAHFSNNKSGYFQDAITILFHYQKKNKAENNGKYFPDESVEKSDTFQFIQTLPEESSFTRLFEQVGSQTKYTEKVHIDGINYHYVTPLFLLLKKEIQEANGCHNTTLTNSNFLDQLMKEPYREHFRYAVILLGLFFSYKYVYDFYYGKSHLRIFQAKPENITVIQETPPMKTAYKVSAPANHSSRRKHRMPKEDPEARKEKLYAIIFAHFANEEKSPLKVKDVKTMLKEAGFSDKFVKDDFNELKAGRLRDIILGKQGRAEVFKRDEQSSFEF